MKVIIVGAGLGGLGCAIACRRRGFEVVVYEQVKEFARLGDSIGFGPNSARLFRRWGVYPEMEAISSKATEVQIFNYDSSDNCLGVDREISLGESKYGCRGLIGHRGDYHLILDRYAKSIGVTIHMATSIASYDQHKPSITTTSGVEDTADVIICAEGVKSLGRFVVLGHEDKPQHSGYAVYRGFMPASLLRDDPVAGKFLANGDSMRLFLAPDMHGFVVTLRDGQEVNAVLTHKDQADVEESWSAPGRKEDVLKLLEKWDPAVRRVWELMPSCIDWKLVFRPCLDKWVSDSGKIALMGDAAHPFLPTSTQGASQAVEDGATIAVCLERCGGDVETALRTYFEIRHDYVADAQATGIKQRETWHNLHEKESGAFKEAFDINAVSQSNYYLWEGDAEKTAEDKWDELSERIRKERKVGVAM
ncbi:Ubiquinone biosynthesis monooxygenase COQ6, mitochondrial [Sphaceloma murrayae]|uniref:Ubiquinone biosynthesis monooxygenase COQ6, mitochondrial n=1 Tax=Sphaceloma murrayae TaxID=2082308 RepID=A0A2K1QL92_9PEZI|nr:Ubiquinone biosynthesis monooxygenase COQ6, mitochondrial [Sphaceloma murrayae]